MGPLGSGLEDSRVSWPIRKQLRFRLRVRKDVHCITCCDSPMSQVTKHATGFTCLLEVLRKLSLFARLWQCCGDL